MVDYPEEYATAQESKDKSKWNKLQGFEKKYIIWFFAIGGILLIWYYNSTDTKPNINYLIGFLIIMFILLLMTHLTSSGILIREQAEAIVRKRIEDDQHSMHGQLPKGYVIMTSAGGTYGPPEIPLQYFWRIGFMIQEYTTGIIYPYFGKVFAYASSPGFVGWEKRPEGIEEKEYRDSGSMKSGFG